MKGLSSLPEDEAKRRLNIYSSCFGLSFLETLIKEHVNVDPTDSHVPYTLFKGASCHECQNMDLFPSPVFVSCNTNLPYQTLWCLDCAPDNPEARTKKVSVTCIECLKHLYRMLQLYPATPPSSESLKLLQGNPVVLRPTWPVLDQPFKLPPAIIARKISKNCATSFLGSNERGSSSFGR